MVGDTSQRNQVLSSLHVRHPFRILKHLAVEPLPLRDTECGEIPKVRLHQKVCNFGSGGDLQVVANSFSIHIFHPGRYLGQEFEGV